MREFRSYGSVRGALRDERPYRDHPTILARISRNRIRKTSFRARTSPQVRHKTVSHLVRVFGIAGQILMKEPLFIEEAPHEYWQERNY
jgi:hypothetical protein